MRGDSHYCAERALVLPGAMCRDYSQGTDVRSSSPTLEGRGKALYEKCSGRAPGHGPRLLAVAGKPASHIDIYWLLHSLRRPEVFAPAGATFETIRRTFVKIAVRVAELKGVIKLPHAAMLAAMTGRDHDAGAAPQ